MTHIMKGNDKVKLAKNQNRFQTWMNCIQAYVTQS